ncbi:MAG: sce7726 family protein [Candidatus Paceibacterota bacterium]|jgi:hypothetical protein
MKKNNSHNLAFTNDEVIRNALRIILEKDLEKYRTENKHPAQIFEEFGVKHGIARIDIAVINGIMHGYEIKSDKDTLNRLREQMKEYNTVFDKLTLVVGKHHLYNAINIVPDWWGIVVAKIDSNNEIVFNTIREAEKNKEQVGSSIAQLLWREEALQILEKRNKATGFRSKPREVIYERLANVVSMDILKKNVRDTLLISREGWRSDLLLASNDD